MPIHGFGLPVLKGFDMMNPSVARERRSHNHGWNDLMVARVAIADDDSETLDLLGDILSSPTTVIYKAASGAELVVLLAEHGPFDLIVTDVDMPWMDGLAAIRSARGSAVQAPVLVISGISRPELSAEVARLGSAQLLRKPIEVSAVRKAVRELLGNKA
jgi:two-component system chemotaxis response regulator CheY